MGRRDSSKTRVVPIFNQLFERDETGASWLDTLIGLGSRKEVVATVPRAQRLVPHHGKRWGTGEMALSAPQALLEYLAGNLDPALVAQSSDTGETRDKRTKLAMRDELTVLEAMIAIKAGQRGKKWFVLEGDSKPDALLETNNIVLCIEGKRTEARCTTTTRWMRQRAQLVRHIDAAMLQFPNQRILGILLVEGEGGADAIRVSKHWHDEADTVISSQMLGASLPHRSLADQELIRENILGVATWQAVCSALRIDWHSLPNVI